MLRRLLRYQWRLPSSLQGGAYNEKHSSLGSRGRSHTTCAGQGRAGHPGVVTYCKDRNSPILRTKSLNTEGSHTKRVLTHKEGNIWQTVLSNRTLQCWKHSLCLSVGH